MGREGAGRARRSRVEQARSPPTARSIRELAAEFARRMKRRAAGELGADGARRSSRARTHARPRPSRRARRRSRRSRPRRRAAGTARRLRRPDRLEPDQLEGVEAGACAGDANAPRPASSGATTSTTACANSAWRAIMNGIALHGGYHPVRRHLPDLLRLQPQRDAHGRADEAARRSSCSRTTRSASAKTARRTSRSSTSSSLRLIPQPATSGARPTRSRRRWPGPRAVEHQRPDGADLLRARTCRSRRVTTRRSRTSRRAATCCATGTTTSRRARSS